MKVSILKERMTMNLAFIAAATDEAQKATENLQKLYSSTTPENADVIIVLGGDGFMLKTLHQFQSLAKPVYGINCGSVGFLMNGYQGRFVGPSEPSKGNRASPFEDGGNRPGWQICDSLCH